MSNIRQAIEHENERISKRIAFLERKLADVPGSIRNTTIRRKDKKKGFYLYLHINGKSHLVHENNKKQVERVDRIIDYRTAKEELKILKNNARALSKGYRLLSDDPQSIRESLPKAYRETPWNRMKIRSEGRWDPEAMRWVEENSERNWSYPEKKTKRTSFGLLDDRDYVEKNLKKISYYHKNGYDIGRNLIITGEGEDQMIDMSMVNDIVEMLASRAARNGCLAA